MTTFIEQVDTPESADPERAVRVGGSHAKLITLERAISEQARQGAAVKRDMAASLHRAHCVALHRTNPRSCFCANRFGLFRWRIWKQGIRWRLWIRGFGGGYGLGEHFRPSDPAMAGCMPPAHDFGPGTKAGTVRHHIQFGKRHAISAAVPPYAERDPEPYPRPQHRHRPVSVVDESQEAPPPPRPRHQIASLPVESTKTHVDKKIAAPPPPKPRALVSSGHPNSGIPAAGDHRFVPDEVLVELRPELSSQTADVVARQERLRLLASQHLTLIGTTLYRYRIEGKRSVAAIVKALEADTRIAAVQPNFLFALQSKLSSGLAEAQYVISRMRLNEAHAISNGAKTLVAVIDSGIDKNHPESQTP